MISQHAYDRIVDRLIISGVAECHRRGLCTKLENFSDTCSEDSAICILRFPTGYEIWAVIRNHNVVTILNRTPTQPKTPMSFRVSRVYWELP